jgi:16S rRNA A1518/A1519 N6-dimethyltransferase RsmA/KsgA/DIM1 with predicted DNA glycosylase/AP lyase activity
MIWLGLALAVIVLSFGGVVLVGAPYLPTLSSQIKAALALADLKPGETLLELGCGDGRVLLAAARKGWQVVGYELNPFLALVAWLRTRRYRKQVKIIWGSYWSREWPDAQAIFVFLLPKYMPKLDKKIIRGATKPVKLVSFAFKITGRTIKSHKNGVYLYEYL